MKSIYTGVQDSKNLINKQQKCSQDTFCTPGYWVTLASSLYDYKPKKISYNLLNLTDRQYGYLDTIGFLEEIFDIQQKNININSGKNYTKLIILKDSYSTEESNKEIRNCLLHQLGFISNDNNMNEIHPHIHDFMNVIGELHDNVWAHGEKTGFSLCQKWTSFTDKEPYIEFALADSGRGFLNELQRVGIAVNTHQEAIDWCIQKGNTSKKTKEDDGWTQSVPDDILGGNPMTGVSIKYQSDFRNHQGLGLAKLLELIQKFKGTLVIISGNAILRVVGTEKLYSTNHMASWDGVAISIKININNLKNFKEEEELEEELEEVLGDFF